MSKYISLREASKISGYHPDYLSALIRQKKIHGDKIGRNWCTTEEDLREYADSLKGEVTTKKNDFKQKTKVVFLRLGYVLAVVAGILFISQMFLSNSKQALADSVSQTKQQKVFEVTTFTADGGDINISVQPIK